MSAAPAPTPAPAAPTAPAAAASGVLGFLGLGGKPANKGTNNKGANNKGANNAGANNKGANNKGANNKGANNKGSNTAALNASLAPAGGQLVAVTRRRTRKQRGGARGKTMRLPGARNVLRVTGKTARKLGRVGVYGLKKVGNGVHVVTGLLGGVLKKTRNVFRRMTKTRRN